MKAFTEIADEILGAILSAHGFVRSTKEHDLATYESGMCTLTVGHDSQRSGEIFIGLNRRNAARRPDFGFDEAIRAAFVPADLQPTGYAARDEKSVRHLLQTMATLLATYCSPLLHGDEAAWSRLSAQRDADVSRYETENRVRQALNDATEAWHSKDFAKVVDLLGPVRSALGTADRAKLEYAERNLGDA